MILIIKYMILLWWVLFYFSDKIKYLYYSNQCNNMDLNIEENTRNIKMLMFLLNRILVKKISFFLRNRILSIYLKDINFCWD